MEQDTKLFIEKHIELIEDNSFDELYRLVKIEDIDCSDLTATLYKAGFYPLDFMTYVPNRFAADIKDVDNYNIPEGVKTIEPFAFDSNGLRSVKFPKTLDDIKKGCFEFCMNLQSIDTANVEYIEEDTFIGCSNLHTLVTSAKVINKFAFKDCSKLMNIYLSDNVNTIGFAAFNHVPATEIHYEGTKDDWSYVTLFDQWNGDIHKVICTDGDVLL